jgi:hypothetical protein
VRRRAVAPYQTQLPGAGKQLIGFAEENSQQLICICDVLWPTYVPFRVKFPSTHTLFNMYSKHGWDGNSKPPFHERHNFSEAYPDNFGQMTLK